MRKTEVPSSRSIKGFCHLHAHSNFTLLTGAAPPSKLAARAARLGLSHAAITDTNALYAAVPFSKACRDLGVTPVIGAHVESGGRHAVLLARDGEGYANLCRLVTRRHLGVDGKGGLDLCEDLPALRRGLAVLVHDPELLKILAGRLDRGQLFAEVVPHGRARAARAAAGPPAAGFDRKVADFDRKVADPSVLFRPEDVLDASEGLGVPPVVTAAAYMSEPGEFPVHRLLVAIKKTSVVSALPDDALARPDSFLKPASELAAGLPGTRHARTALTNAAAVAAECGFAFKEEAPRFPSFRLDPGETPYSRLCKLVFGRAAERYRPLRPDVVRRLERELGIIDSLGFAGYFIIVHDIVAFARSRGIPAVGRGSAAGSLVAYLLDITRADPLEHDLYFERFLNPDRSGCPDIDVDLCWKQRDEVIDYVFAKYGAEHTAMISTFNTFRFRAAFRDIALAYGAPPARVDALSRLLPHYVDGGGGGNIEERIGEYPEMRRFPLHRAPYGDALRHAAAVEGFPRHLSIHPGGLVIGPTRLDELVPLERAAKGVVISQYDMDPVEELGLVKIDLLGQRGLTAVAEARRFVHANRGVAIAPETTPADDADTIELLRSGRTIGCFQIESPAMRGLLVQLQARRKEDVIAAIALIRPGPSSSGMKEAYIRRHLGLEKARYTHPLLEKVLSATHGVMLYQEDVLRVAREVAGFSLAEADTLRKAMTKKRSSRLFASLRERFIRGAAGRGLDEEEAARVFSGMEGFASYSFCKAHAVTYGLIAFEAAFLKAHYPAELMAAVIANGGGFYRSGVYVEEARRLGVAVLPPCVNRSESSCRPEPRGQRGAIRPGLDQIGGLSRATAGAILRARRDGPYLSLGDFLRRTGARESEAEALVHCGAFDFTDLCRPELLWRLKVRFKERPSSRDEAGVLFEHPPPQTRRSFPPIADYSLEKKLEGEYEHLGFTPSAHPMTPFMPLAARERATACAGVPARVNRRVKVAGWVVAARRVRSAEGRLMKFMTLEDASGVVEATLFPDAYRRLGHLAVGGGPCLVGGYVEERLGFPTLDVRSLAPLGADE